MFQFQLPWRLSQLFDVGNAADCPGYCPGFAADCPGFAPVIAPDLLQICPGFAPVIAPVIAPDLPRFSTQLESYLKFTNVSDVVIYST
ncbi:MAG: hypothetical protein GY748_25995 [Planctomycetaceae bacterium]|nr:hypothetical protein [Planctomycetaceae bacterium]